MYSKVVKASERTVVSVVETAESDFLLQTVLHIGSGKYAHQQMMLQPETLSAICEIICDIKETARLKLKEAGNSAPNNGSTKAG